MLALNTAAADSSATGAESVAVGPRALANANNSIAMGNGAVVANNATGGIAIGAGATANNSNDIALGSNSTTDTAVGTSGTTIRGTEYNFAGSAPVGTVSVGSAGNERTVTNVAAGRIAANSTDAVNGSQLHATNEAIEHLSDGLGNMAEGAVMYDRTREGGRMNSITLKGSADVPVTVRNVAAGVADTDVVNVGQLNNSIAAANSYADQVGASVLEQSTSYTDKRINALGFDLSKIRKDANSGIASAMAMSQIPQAFEPGMGMVGMGVSTWQGQQAIAVGLSKAADNGRIVVRASGTYNSRGKGGASAGVGLQF